LILMRKIKLLATLMIVMTAAVLMTPAYALLFIPGLDSKIVSDSGSIVDVLINTLGVIPDPAPGPSGYGAIIGSTSAGAPVVVATTSHMGVCDSDSQTLGVCEGTWHQHYAILNGTANAQNTCGPAPGTLGVDKFRIQHLSFESLGSNTINNGNIEINSMAKNPGLLNNAIDGTFPGVLTPFNFAPADLSIQPAYPVVAFNVFVGNGGALDGLGIPVPLNGIREVCVYNVELMVVDPQVAGIINPLDTTSLVVAGTLANAFWILPMVGGVAGLGIYLARSKLQK
jgi:hypothetical protein